MGDGDAGLAAVAGEPRRGVQQQRSRGDGLGMLKGIGQAHEQAPPVVGQRGDAGHDVITSYSIHYTKLYEQTIRCVLDIFCVIKELKSFF